jgi:hypothetical protein
LSWTNCGIPLRLAGPPAGTGPEHYVADEGDATVRHMTALIDGERVADDPKGGSRRKVLSRY